MSALTHIDAIRERLAGAVPALAAVHSALEFAGDGRKVARVPAAIVMPAADAGGENRAGGAGTVQRITTTVAVTVIVPVRNDPRGERALDELTPLVDAVRGALIGWAPAPSRDLRLIRGSLVDIEHNRAWWEDVYEFGRFINALDRRSP